MFVHRWDAAAVPGQEGTAICHARVDPHLMVGCEIFLGDVDMRLLEPLQKVQHAFLQRLVGLNPKAARAFCFPETGVLPPAHGRIILAVRYL